MRPFLGLNVPLRAALGFELFIGLSLGRLAFRWPWPSAVEFFFLIMICLGLRAFHWVSPWAVDYLFKFFFVVFYALGV